MLGNDTSRLNVSSWNEACSFFATGIMLLLELNPLFFPDTTRRQAEQRKGMPANASQPAFEVNFRPCCYLWS
jgi:hypothetical protein